MLRGLALLIVCVAVGTAYGSDLEHPAPVELVITTHNPVCTAVFLHHIDVARLTDVRPLPAMPHYYGSDAYSIDELRNGTGVSAVVWPHQVNGTMRAILEQPEVISVAAYPYAAPNATHSGWPEPLALAANPQAGVMPDPIDPPYRCATVGSYFKLGLMMESIGWAGVSAPVPGPEPASAQGASGASELALAPLALDRDPGFDAQPDPRTKILYYDGLMHVEIRTYNVTDTWAYLKANGALVVDVIGVDEPFGIVGAYIPPPLMWSSYMEENTFSVRPVTRGAYTESYGGITTEGITNHIHPAVKIYHEYGWDGTGIKVGVLDDGFIIRDNPELPSDIDERCYADEYPDDIDGNLVSNCNRGSYEEQAHGAGVAEIIMDMAPGVDLYLYPLAGERVKNLHEGVEWLRDQGVDIISASLRYPYEGPGDGTTPVREDMSALGAIEVAARANILWVNSVGNYGERGWTASNPQTHPQDGATWVDFSETDVPDIDNRITNEPCSTTVDLRWRGGNNLTLHQYDSDGHDTGVLSENTVHEAAPVRSMSVAGYDINIRIKVEADSDGTVDVPDWVQLVAYGECATLKYTTPGGAINTPADSSNPKMVAVGGIVAMGDDKYAKWQLPPYISYGNTSDGRMKPEVLGATHVSTWAHVEYLSDSYGVDKFEGSSAAAPHIAGLAAIYDGLLNKAKSAEYILQILGSPENKRETDTVTGDNLRVAGLPWLEPNTESKTNNRPVVLMDNAKSIKMHQGRTDNVYLMLVRDRDIGDTVFWNATSSNSSVVTVAHPHPRTEMERVPSNEEYWYGSVELTPRSAGTAMVAINVTDGSSFALRMLDITVTSNTHPVLTHTNIPYRFVTGNNYTIAFSATDIDNDALTYKYVIAEPDNHFNIPILGECEMISNFRQCALPGNTLILTPIYTGNSPASDAMLYGVFDGQGGRDIDGVGMSIVGSNQPPIHHPISDATIKSGETATVQIQATDADGDVIRHASPRSSNAESVQASLPIHWSGRESVGAGDTGTVTGRSTVESITIENDTLASVTVVQRSPTGHLLRYSVNDTGIIPAMPESVTSGYSNTRSAEPTTLNQTLVLRGLAVGNTTITSIVYDVWGDYSTQNFTVTVLPAVPVITLAGSANMTVPFNTTYVEPGYTATDREDGDLTGNVTVTGTVDTTRLGTHTIHYDVADSDGNNATRQIRTVNVADLVPPVITLASPTNMTVSLDSTYVDPGYLAADDYDGDLTGNVTVTGMVDTGRIGTYTLYYDVADSSGNNAAQQNRTINVAAGLVTTWRTVSSNESITIPVDGAAGAYNIDWGDGTASSNVIGSQTHTYASSGEHTVRISGDFSKIYLGGDSANAAKLISIDGWGGIQWSTMREAFAGAANMAYNATDSPDLSRVTDMSGMFRSATSFNGDISSWNVTSVTDMSGMLYGASSFRQDLGAWYVIPDGTSIRYLDTPGVVGQISSQNIFLDGQGPAYGIGTGGDSALFSINGTTLVMKATPDRPIQNPYVVNVTAGGALFGENNHRIIPVHVELPPSVPPAVSAGADLTVFEGGHATIHGTASDPDPEDTLAMQWTQHPAHPAIQLDDAASPSTSFTAPLVTANTTLTLTLTATDSRNATTSDAITVRIVDTPLPPGAFITTWTTTLPNQSITIPVGGHTGTYDIDWGDGTISYDVTGDQTHEYASPGRHTIVIVGDFDRIRLSGNFANSAKLASIDQWGDIRWSSMESAFAEARSMAYRAADAPDLSRVADMSQMFRGAASFNGDISSWNVSSATDMAAMFYGASSFNQDISSWNVSYVTDMSWMFSGASSFNQDISSWNVSSVTDISHMFYRASSFNQDISSWDVSSVADMSWMFSDARSFNGNISSWNVSSATDMSGLFDGASSFHQNLGAWYIVPDSAAIGWRDAPGTVGTISSQNAILDNQNPAYGIGTGGDSALFHIAGSRLVMDATPAKPAYTVNVTSTGIFGTSNHHTLEIHIDGYVNRPPAVDAGADQTIPEGFVVRLAGNATDPDGDAISYLWTHDSILNITLADAASPSTTFIAPRIDSATTIPLTLTVTDSRNATASDSVNVTIRDVPEPSSHFVTTWRTTAPNDPITIPVGDAAGPYTIHWGDDAVSIGVTGSQTHAYAAPGDHTVRIYGDFSRIHLGGDPANARKIVSIGQWGDIRWTSMESAFSGASSMTYNAADAPDLSQVADMSGMFDGATSFNGDISSWDVSHVTDMSGMFDGATSFNGDISSWDVSQVTDMSGMFTYATSFNGDISSWDVSNVRDMSEMFTGAPFNGDISAWDVSHVADMNLMFAGAPFNGDISSWDVSHVTDMSGMFSGATSFNGDISSWNVSQAVHMFTMFAGATSFNQDISSWDVSSATDMFWMFSGASSFRQNLGAWYIAPDSTTIQRDDAPGTVGTISPQNTFLDGHSPTYGVGTGGDSGLFNVTGSDLVLDAVPDKHTYTVNVTSTGAFGTNNHHILQISVSDPNGPPTADAGPDRTVQGGSTVRLSGNATDPDGDTLTYLWTHDSILNITLADATSLSTTFTAPAVHANTTITFTLTASDAAASTTDSVSITITPAAAPPAIPTNLRAAPAIFSATLTWDDPNDDTITGYKILYRIPATQPNLHTLVNDTGSADTTYTVQNLEPGTAYVFRITAISEHGESERSDPASVSTLQNNPPVSDAGPDQTVRPGQTTTLNGTASYDPDGHTISYSWNQTSGPDIALSGHDTASPTFEAPAVTNHTVLTFQLTISDGRLISNDTVDITIQPDRPPAITLAGQTNMTIQVGSTYTEPGYAATDDIDGDLTANVIVTGMVDTSTIGVYTLHYDVTDSSGNAAATQTRTIRVADDTSPVITLSGSTNMTISVGATYTDPGYTATDNYDGDITGSVTVSGTVDADTVGTYTIHYDVSDSSGNAAATQTRTIRVADDTSPVITLSGSTNMTIQVGSTYTEPGYAATDQEDGDLTANVTVTGTVDATTTGTYTIHYDVSDSSGNAAATQTRTIRVTDTTLPVITLSGSANMTIQVSSTYTEPGYTATDNYDGDITGSVTVSGTVDVNTTGTYTIRYDVTDSSGNAAATQTRTIHVVDDTPPAITLAGHTNMTIQVGSTYAEPGYMATDNYDGDITGSVTVTGTVGVNMIGTYTLHYDVADSSGNAAATQTRTVRVTDTTPPVITLSGASSMLIPFGSTYTEPGYTATDNYDGDITGNVMVSGTVDTDTTGTYTIYYDVSDSSGNAAVQQARIVSVSSPPPPAAPASLQASDITATSAALSWDAPSGHVTGYKIMYRISAPGSQLETLVGNTGNSLTAYTVQELEPGTAYAFRVIAIGPGGESSMSNFVRVDTNAPPPPAAPSNLQVSNVTTTSAILSWDNPADASITGYKIMYRTPATQSSLGVLVGDTGSSDTSYTVNDLEPGTVHIFRIIAINEHGESKISNPVRVTTLDG